MGKLTVVLSGRGVKEKAGAKVFPLEKDIVVLDSIVPDDYEGNHYRKLIFQLWRKFGSDYRLLGEWSVSEKLFFNVHTNIEGEDVEFTGSLKEALMESTTKEEQELLCGAACVCSTPNKQKIKPYDKEIERTFYDIKVLSWDANEWNGKLNATPGERPTLDSDD